VSDNEAHQVGPDDEPQESGAVVAVWWGDYRRQEIWVRSGANIGNWYCLGGEFGTPKVWDPPKDPYGLVGHDRKPVPQRPAGTVPQHPDWWFIVRRGPVTILTPGDEDTYLAGWRAGRRDLWQSMEEATDYGPTEPYVPVRPAVTAP
jgi:hypothetical protein